MIYGGWKCIDWIAFGIYSQLQWALMLKLEVFLSGCWIPFGVKFNLTGIGKVTRFYVIALGIESSNQFDPFWLFEYWFLTRFATMEWYGWKQGFEEINYLLVWWQFVAFELIDFDRGAGEVGNELVVNAKSGGKLH